MKTAAASPRKSRLYPFVGILTDAARAKDVKGRPYFTMHGIKSKDQAPVTLQVFNNAFEQVTDAFVSGEYKIGEEIRALCEFKNRKLVRVVKVLSKSKPEVTAVAA